MTFFGGEDGAGATLSDGDSSVLTDGPDRSLTRLNPHSRYMRKSPCHDTVGKSGDAMWGILSRKFLAKLA